MAKKPEKTGEIQIQKKDTKFKPGQSGNPAGKPKGSYSLVTILKRKLKEAIAKGGKEAGEELVDLWIEKAKSEKEFNALKEIVRYVDGMPKQPIVGGSEDDEPISLKWK